MPRSVHRSLIIVGACALAACTALVGAEGVEALPAAEPSAAAEGGASFFEQGGRTMWFLAALSIVGVFVALERLLNLSRSNFIGNDFAAKADKLWRSGDRAALAKACSEDGSALARMVSAANDRRDQGIAAAKEGAADVASRVVRSHTQSAYWLAVVATLSPLLGLLGTVLGMIESFEVIAIAGDIGNTADVAGGIAKALVTTAAGLIIAVPALALFHVFKVRANRLSIILEDAASSLMDRWFVGKAEA